MAEASSEATSSSVGDGVEIVDDGTSSEDGEESEKDEQDSQEWRYGDIFWSIMMSIMREIWSIIEEIKKNNERKYGNF